MSQQEPEQIREEIDETRARLSQDVDTLAESAKPSAVVGRRVDQAREAVGEAKDRIMGRADDVGHQLGDQASGASGQVSDQVSKAADGVRQAPAAVRSRTEGSPLTAGLIAFGIGYLLGAMLPASRTERQAAERLGEVSGPVGRELSDSAHAVAQDLKEEATDAARSLGESTKEAASAVTGAARSES